MKHLLIIILVFFGCAAPQADRPKFSPPQEWTLFQTSEDLREFFGEAYSTDMQWAIVKNDRSAYIVVKVEEYTINLSGAALDDAVTRFLEAVFEKKRNVFGMYDYTYAIYDGAIQRGDRLIATEKFRDFVDGVECDSTSNILFYRCGSKSCFTFVSMTSLPDETEASLPVLSAATESF